VNGRITPPVEHRGFEFFREKANALQAFKGNVRSPVACGLDDDQFEGDLGGNSVQRLYD